MGFAVRFRHSCSVGFGTTADIVVKPHSNRGLYTALSAAAPAPFAPLFEEANSLRCAVAREEMMRGMTGIFVSYKLWVYVLILGDPLATHFLFETLKMLPMDS